MEGTFYWIILGGNGDVAWVAFKYHKNIASLFITGNKKKKILQKRSRFCKEPLAVMLGKGSLWPHRLRRALDKPRVYDSFKLWKKLEKFKEPCNAFKMKYKRFNSGSSIPDIFKWRNNYERTHYKVIIACNTRPCCSCLFLFYRRSNWLAVWLK